MRKLLNESILTYSFKNGSGLYEVDIKHFNQLFNKPESKCYYLDSELLKFPDSKMAFRSIFTSTLKV